MRPWRSRFVAVLSAFWLLVVQSEPAALHGCAMHGADTASAAPHDASAAHHAAAEAHHDAPDSHQAAGGHGPADAPTHESCSCLGDCSSVVAVVLPAARVSGVELLAVHADARGGLTREVAVAWVDFVLPFATAPPILLAA